MNSVGGGRLRLTLEEGRFLVRLARKSIESSLKGEEPEIPRAGERLREKRGVFVTLTKKGELRGCIGFPFPFLPLVEATVKAAVSAAFEDPRFPPLRREEFGEVLIEVSVLDEPEIIQVKNPREYPKAIKIGEHGLIVEGFGTSGLLLPQVAVEWNWDAEEFLSQCCMKAGLPPDMWLTKEVRISRFTAQIFTELSPGGEVVEKKLGCELKG
jgi:uncharacterized protein (TIGR00296 family)